MIRRLLINPVRLLRYLQPPRLSLALRHHHSPQLPFALYHNHLHPCHLTYAHQHLSRSALAPLALRPNHLHLDRHHPHIYRGHHYLHSHPRMQSRPQRPKRTRSESELNWWQKERLCWRTVDAKSPSMMRILQNWMRSCNRSNMPAVFSISLSKHEIEHLL